MQRCCWATLKANIRSDSSFLSNYVHMTSPQKIISDCDSLIPLPEFQLFLFHQNGCCLREASHIDFVHEKRLMDVGWWGGGGGR